MLSIAKNGKIIEYAKLNEIKKITIKIHFGIFHGLFI